MQIKKKFTKIIHQITTYSHQEQLRILELKSIVQPLRRIATQGKPQEIRSFIKCVLPQHCKNKAPIIKNWIVQKRIHNKAVKYEEIFWNV